MSFVSGKGKRYKRRLGLASDSESEEESHADEGRSRKLARGETAAGGREGGVSPAPSLVSTVAEISDTVLDSGGEPSVGGGGPVKEGEKGKGRGRPATTGDFAQLARAKERLVEASRKELALEEERAILDPMTGLSEKLRKQGSGMMERYAEEYRRAPVNDLAAAIAMSVEAVLKCTGISKGLKGSIAKQIREETCRAAACATLLSLQAQKPPEEREADEMAALRRELEAARKESGQLREENRALRDRAAELPSLERRQAAARFGSPSPHGGTRETRLSLPCVEGHTAMDMDPPPSPPRSVGRGEGGPVLGEGTRGTGGGPGGGGGGGLVALPPLVLPTLGGRERSIPDEGAVSAQIGRLLAGVDLKAAFMARLDAIFGEWLAERPGVVAAAAGRGARRSGGVGGGGPSAAGPLGGPSLPVAGGTAGAPSPPPPGGEGGDGDGGGKGRQKKKRKKKGGRGPGGSGAGTSGPAPAGAAAPGPPAVGPAGAGGAASGAGPAPVPPGGGGATRSYASVASAAPSGARGGAARRGKDKGKGKGGAAGDGRGAPVPSAPPAAAADVTVRRASGGKARRTPATRAVAVTCEDGAYAETLREARSKIDLASLGVSEVRPRRAQTGALLLEVPNRDGQDGADRLAEKLRQVLEGKKGVRVTQPVKMAELRLGGLEESVTPDEISRALADKGGCPVGDIKLGEPRRAPGGLFTVWARCPLAAANRIAAVDGGRLVVGGWFRVRAELLGVRPLQCFRCLQRGHVRSVCGSKEDRSDTCYRCGGAGHRAAGCTAPVKCPVCARAGRPCGHRVGGPQCGAPVVRGGLPPAREARSGAAAPGNAGSGGPPSGGSSPVLGGAAAAVAAAATEGPMEVDPLPEGGGGPPLPQRESRDDPKGAEDASLSVHNAP
ncbi:homeotic protein female sterile-like [Monomorium pharaonis]|uniref:homeotic protein female sterile-like n=1 Tax=Monomorium pharaonis TaxID=307658 RepID=UPI001745E23D|nr:homeotic protein female sterile-like [Monomorium pharaonis]XP_036151162.1 homeotic protein female sterile-like [Monomorium pharaonis]